MSTHRLQTESHQVFFCTVTCYNWLPLILEAAGFQSLYRWFDHLKNDGCLLLGYVIMPNHYHVLLYPTHSGTAINQLVGEGKRFLAYDIVNSLFVQEKFDLLEKLKKGVSVREQKRGKIHQVFRVSFDARICFSEKMIEQKLDYIHHNPVRGKWSLVEDFVDYPHSSARFYELSEENQFLTHYKAL